MQRLWRMNALVELLLQRALGVLRQTAYHCLLASELGQDRQFALHIGAGNSVPQSIFERENVQLLLLDTKNLSLWELNNDFLRANIDREVLLEIETSLGDECAMQFHALRAANPGMKKLM